MANEATISVGLQVVKGNLNYLSQPQSFQANIETGKGPSPGAITASIEGTIVDLSQLARPGLCWIGNLDDTNFVTIAVYDGANWFPLLELLPGEFYPLRLSRYLNEEFVGTGTGTSSDANQLMIIADTADCVVRVDAFDS